MFFEKKTKFFCAAQKISKRTGKEVQNFCNSADTGGKRGIDEPAWQQKIENGSAQGKHGHIDPLLTVAGRKSLPEKREGKQQSIDQIQKEAQYFRCTIMPDHPEKIVDDPQYSAEHNRRSGCVKLIFYGNVHLPE